MRKIEIGQEVIPIVSEELKRAPLPVAVTILMRDAPRNAQLVGLAKNGKAYFEIREKLWIETYG